MTQSEECPRRLTKRRLRISETLNPPHLKNKKRLYSDWMVVRVKNECERFAKRQIELAGWQCIAPFIWDENARPREVPMFPGYVFVKGEFSGKLNTTRGVVTVLMGAGQPARMPIKAMRSLLKMINLGDDILDVTQKPAQIGDKVKVKKGVLLDWVGVYTADSARGRVKVLLQVLGTEREVELPRSFIVPA